MLLVFLFNVHLYISSALTWNYLELLNCLVLQDLGCGWGSLGLYVCEKFPQCQVTCISNSNTQRQFIESRAQQLGFSGRLTVITADANTFCTDIKYDRIFSIEMFEVKESHSSCILLCVNECCNSLCIVNVRFLL